MDLLTAPLARPPLIAQPEGKVLLDVQVRKQQVVLEDNADVPVLGRNGEMLAAIAIQAPEARMNVQIARGHLPALRRATEELAETFQDET